jgi:hypothetical protein
MASPVEASAEIWTKFGPNCHWPKQKGSTFSLQEIDKSANKETAPVIIIFNPLLQKLNIPTVLYYLKFDQKNNIKMRIGGQFFS